MIPKLGDNGRIYYVGYAPFFDAESTQCNDVSWSFWWNQANSTVLSTNIRQNLNDTVERLNGILGELVKGAGKNVVFVDYSGWVAEVGGRFFGDGIIEPSGDNEDLFFYEWDTIDDWEYTGDDKDELSSTAEVGNGTFAGQIRTWIEEAQAVDPDLVMRNIFANDTSQGNDTLLDNLTGRDALGFDSIFCVFHPTQIGHNLIANLVLYSLGAERAGMLSQPVMPSIAAMLPTSCPVANSSSDGGIITASSLDCTTTTDRPSDLWFDTETAIEFRENFCRYVANSNTTNIANQDSKLGLSYPFFGEYPLETWVEVWVQNVGCDEPRLYVSEDTCHAMIDAIVDDCKSLRNLSSSIIVILTRIRRTG